MQAITAWRQRHPALPVVVLPSADDRARVLVAMAAGAAGFMPKTSRNEVMLSALPLVLAGGKYLPVEVLEFIARGKPNKIICDEPGLAERTAKAHFNEILGALGVSSRTLALPAEARRLLALEDPA